MELKRFNVSFQTYILNPSFDRINMIESLYASSDDAPMYPEEGLTVLYGKRFGFESLSKATSDALANGEKLVPIIIEMEAWRPKGTAHWFDDMEGKTVFDLRRLSKQLNIENLIIEYFSRYMNEDGFAEADVRNRDHSAKSDFANFPSYLDRLRKEPEFSHVDAFIWQTEEDGQSVVRATIYNTDPIKSVKPVGSKIDVDYPRFSNSKAA
jgi:hypothetical protein